MFVFKSTYDTEIKRLGEKLRLMELTAQMFKDVAESRFGQYERQIEDLRKLVFVPKYEARPESLEADAVISGSEKPIGMSEEEFNKRFEEIREADLLLSGNYAEDLIQ